MNRSRSTTQSPDYTAVREGAVIGAVSPRSQLAVAGADRASFLQGLLTNDIQVLRPGSGCYAAWLTREGRMLTDLHVFEGEGMMLLDVPADSAAATLARLDQFLFSEDVRLESLSGAMTGVWLHGPSAAGVAEQIIDAVGGLSEWTDYQHMTARFGAHPVSVARVDQLGVPGYCIFLAPDLQQKFLAAASAAGALHIAADVLAAARIEAGYPVFGIDMTEDTIPLEAGIEKRAISLSKGCYVGQEIIIRVLHRGGGRVARKLVGMKLSDAAADGTKVFAGEREIGFLTSSAVSPRFGPIALGYVHRDFTSPGTTVRVDGREALVAALPIAD